MSCAGNGYLSGNMLTPFPFEDGQFLSWGEGCDPAEAQRALQRCFVDAMICVDVCEIRNEEWPSLGNFSVNGSWISFDVCAAGAESHVFVSDGANMFPVVHGSAPWGSYVVTLSAEGIRDFRNSGFTPPVPDSSSPGPEGIFSLRLCQRCVVLRPMQVEAIRVLDGDNPPAYGRKARAYSAGDFCWRNGFFRCVNDVPYGAAWNSDDWEAVGAGEVSPSFTLAGNVEIRPGNNMVLAQPEGADEDDGIDIRAVPGAGLGVVSCGCSGRAARVSPIMSPDGHTRFFNDTCYDLEPNTLTGELKVHVKCTACCTCEMYKSMVDRLASIADSIRGAREDLMGDGGLLEKYEGAVERFNYRLTHPELSDVTMSLSGMPMGANLGCKLSKGSSSGRMQRCAFTAIVRNSSYALVRASIYGLSGTDTISEASVSWSDAAGDPKTYTRDSGVDMIGKSFDIQPGRSMSITFVAVKSGMVKKVTTGGYVGSVSVGLSWVDKDGTVTGLGTLSRTAEV